MNTNKSPTIATYTPEKHTSFISDLVLTGVLTAVYLVIHFCCNIIGAASPFLQIFGSAISILINGITLTLLLTRLHHRWLISISAIILGTAMVMLGDPYSTFISALCAGVISAAIAKYGECTTTRKIISIVIFSMWPSGSFIIFLLQRQAALNQIATQMGIEYMEKFAHIFSTAHLICILFMYPIAGFIGAFIGNRVIGKHFRTNNTLR